MKNIAHINSIASYRPNTVLTNQDLEKMVDTSDEWIVSRTGMKERHIADANESTSDMGAKAANLALKRAKIDVEDIDLILVATLSPDCIFPSTACYIQEKIGARNASAMDIGAACSGMIYLLATAKAYVESGLAKNILAIAAEKVSSFIDYKDRNTCVLFGDGAAACIVSAKKQGFSIDHVELGADGSGAELLKVKAGGSKIPASIESVANKEHVIQMDGKAIFKHAIRRMEQSLNSCLENQNLNGSDIDFLVPHQANMRIIDAIAKRCKISEDNVFNVIDRTGNTCAASIGIGLDILLSSHKLVGEEKLLLLAFGAGLTWGSALLTKLKESVNE